MKYLEIIKTYFEGITSYKQDANLIVCDVSAEELVEICVHFYKKHKLPLKTIKAVDNRSISGDFKIYYIFGIPHEEYFPTVVLHLKETIEFPSLVREIHQAVLYEAEIVSFFGLHAVGNPHTQPFLLQENWPINMFPLRKDFDWKKRPVYASTPYSFQEIKGEGIYEIPVGPVHAGIIEPGHFRFSVAGEEIVHLEAQLGYTHKGSEKLFEILPLQDKLRLAERISGDTSFGHALAFCQAVETLSEMKVSLRAQYIRVILLELERIANHVNDVGFILNDTAFSFGGSNGQRLKEQIMQLNEALCGSRFLRGAVLIGGVSVDVTEEQKSLIQSVLTAVKNDFFELVTIVEDSETVLNRLNKTGWLDKEVALNYGAVGVAARASGIPIDARKEYQYGIYNTLPMKVSSCQSGDVYARFSVRIQEVFISIDLIMQALIKLDQKEPLVVTVKPMRKNSHAVRIVEGWRGDIVYFVSTDDNGDIDRVGVRDASFLNWQVVPFAVVGDIVPDFPLINKSFNLSYSGFDR
jgi:Ni,Fe-hydrogenase III large subunit/Ni,Fe-hydrogenase III component G